MCCIHNRTFPPTQHSCTAPFFEDVIVAQKVDAETFTKYQAVKGRLLESKLAREAAVEMEKKIAR